MNTSLGSACGRWRLRRESKKTSKVERPTSNFEFKDHFSKQAADYAKFRPRYPKQLFQWLASIAPGRDLAWDCATGNGQAAVELAEVFGRVVATDASEKQVANAERHAGVQYRVASAEASGLESSSIDLITVAQALHWFDLAKFYSEARRVLKPRGIVAAWAYKLATVARPIDAVVNHYYEDVVGPYWPAERGLVEKFEELSFPFPAVETPAFEMVVEWNVEQLLGYLGTWSATQRFMAAEKCNPLEGVEKELRKVWGAETRRVTWPLTIKVGRL
jgi:ubiquinone/menaquinone biosynthesis C-methylase UbiE